MCLQATFTWDSHWDEEEGKETRSPPINEIVVIWEEAMKLLAYLDTRKLHSPNGIVNLILKDAQKNC